MDVSVIIVNYNTKAYLNDCLKSVYQHTKDIEFEVLVSDNGSTDGSIESVKQNFKNVILIENKKNIGFGAANNKALDIAKGEFILFLNSDTVLINNGIKIFYDFWYNYPHPELLGALGCNLLNKDLRITNSGGCFFAFWRDLKYFFKIYCYLILISFGYKRKKRVPVVNKYFGEIDVIVGADLFLKNNEDAYFDDYFFLYHEEVDLEYRLAKKGLKRILIDGPEIIHFEGKSDNADVLNKKYAYHSSFSRINDFLSRIKYYKKNKNNPVAFFLLKFIILLIFIYPPLFTRTSRYLKDLLAI
ncbi:glycosyl transferase [Spirochaetia bacterium]|nr:glycosyl transferase [Spirochaetia bacterium]